MPTYKNNLNVDVALEGNSIPAGETLQTTVYYSSLPTGVTKESDLPSYNPIVVSATESGNLNDVATVNIPTVLNGIPIEGVEGSIYCADGGVEIRFNDASNDPPIVLGKGYTYNVGVRQRLINTIHLKFTAASSSVVINLQRS